MQNWHDFIHHLRNARQRHAKTYSMAYQVGCALRDHGFIPPTGSGVLADIVDSEEPIEGFVFEWHLSDGGFFEIECDKQDRGYEFCWIRKVNPGNNYEADEGDLAAVLEFAKRRLPKTEGLENA